jgi:plasmanylethanolamine desaturase
MASAPKLKQQDARVLANGYTSPIRRLEVGSIAAFFIAIGVLAARLWPWIPQSPWLVLTAFLLGFLAADFISGFVHWLADTWGRTDMPVVGSMLLRPFREHHVDPEAIARHDFVETNGNNCLVCVVPVGLVILLPQRPGEWFNLFFASFMGSCALWILGTNQFHKWAHMKHPPLLAVWLQRLHLILPPEHHAIHHTAPFNKYYCITVGWLNRPLQIIRFFQVLEYLVTWTTGVIPRQDDIGERAASELAPKIAAPEAHFSAHAQKTL